MPYSILSLDGGGTWALIQARILEQRFGRSARGHEILKQFDLVIANSGGSLVLSQLIANKNIGEILDIFNNTGVLRSIFKERFIASIPVLKDLMPRFATQDKLKVFEEQLFHEGISYGTTLMTELPSYIGDGCPDIVVCAFDYDRQRATFFRSNLHSKMESGYIERIVGGQESPDAFKAVTLAQAIHASSNAPVQFFDAPASFPLTMVQSDGSKTLSKDRLYWDGAVGANNNPVKAGVLEALANSIDRDERRREIRVVSIGTANTILPVLDGSAGETQSQYDWLIRYSQMDGYIGDLARMASAVISDPPDSSSFEAHQLLDLELKQEDVRFIRLNPLVKPVRKKLPGHTKYGWYMPGIEGRWTEKEMKDLFEMDMAVTTGYGLDLINRLCDDYFADAFHNQGIRTGGPGIEPILGHKYYSTAMRDWKKWDEHINAAIT